MSASQNPGPGWYPNSQGLIQWWDGSSWGALADQAASPEPSPAPSPAEPLAPTEPVTPAEPLAPPTRARAAAPAPTLTPLASPPKPAVSLLVWASIGCTVLGALCLVLIIVVLDRSTSSSGASNLAAVSGLLQIGGIGLTVAGMALAIVGLARSARKRPAVLAIVFSGLVLTSPVWLVLLGWVWWFAAGAFSQLTGGPTVG